jgi:hypothetical protein
MKNKEDKEMKLGLGGYKPENKLEIYELIGGLD